MRVLVVGAGFAGLAAAHALRERGDEVVVLEAADRVGGRVRSATTANGCVVELGAEFVLPAHATLIGLARELGLELYEKGTLYGNREPRGGEPVEREEVVRAVREAAPLSRADEALPDLLARAGVEPRVREAILARIEVTTAYPAADQPGTVLGDDGASFGDFPTYGVAGGNQRLAEALARGLDVRVSSPVERIVWSGNGVRIGEVAADGCVVAVPATYVWTIEFDPSLPEWKLAALAAVSYGQAVKLFLPLARAAPPSATLSVPGRFWTYTQLASDGEPLPVACSFGRAADDWPAAVRTLRPDLDYADAEPLASSWPEAYSARSLAAPLDDDALAAPVGPLAFAGEHTAGEWHALMEGALRSGLRAAADLARPRGPAELDMWRELRYNSGHK